MNTVDASIPRHIQKFYEDFIQDIINNHMGLVDQACRRLIMSNVFPERIALEYSDDGQNIWLTLDGVRIFVANRKLEGEQEFMKDHSHPLQFVFTGLWLGQWDHLNG